MQSIFAGLHSAAANATQRYQSAEFRDTVQIEVPESIRDRKVHSVVVHGTKNEAEGYVHWRLYFQMDRQSIEFNSQKRTADGITMLYIEYRKYRCSTNQPSIGEKDRAL
ncbi:hypothetical protein M413DRAFT_32178 [Hebeloma cylindrosporum]|uniref:DUF7770 domain-containing protein n=1 Tax=Hebeloma cylindrosporum TaxID=76867 RepID=A0A0C2Y419_HEBCY|nr:hypothetical protein M413DRAFT_32178 [Hebeloma cylindrosporum h7]